MVVIVLTMTIIDHPALFAKHRRQEGILDRALRDEASLTGYLEEPHVPGPRERGRSAGGRPRRPPAGAGDRPPGDGEMPAGARQAPASDGGSESGADAG
ncbi:hypothetical protein BH708_14820 [Brachybacterium sp. P6-10-X1]|uniref:hypothetical protein n=1 Tax=Brachybacterium sp. P6-10-X1 TaxID=1903186 RepID=UPI000971BD94|nr:hypothetical protein [Brachybacterium sp. P6-10-X1]APX33771.1 hypothetical protein BH708_14820 [Brachybacterium sp. P6-10-X1]